MSMHKNELFQRKDEAPEKETIKKHRDLFYECYRKMRLLDSYASDLNNWEARCFDNDIYITLDTQKAIFKIEDQQRELLINAMYHNTIAKVKDVVIDDYFRRKVYVLRTQS